jgi:hypothetical protein
MFFSGKYPGIFSHLFMLELPVKRIRSLLPSRETYFLFIVSISLLNLRGS